MFNPFGKNLSSVEGLDLGILRSTNEGWFIEYKSTLIEPVAIGKAISAFANHDGGWLFLGITERDNHADEFTGIPHNELELAERRLRESVSRHCSPSPHYEKKFILGPVPEIGLPQDRCIVIVCIPRSHNTPHVHSSGRIYRRIDSSSEPKPETDRAVLDALWNRRKAARKRMERFCSWRPETAKREAETSYLHLTLMADPFDDHDLWSTIGFDRFREIMSDTAAGGITFDNIYPCFGGAIARQVSTNNPSSQIFTYRYYSNGNARITIPINTFSVTEHLSSFHTHGVSAQPFVQAVRERGYTNFVAVDLSRLLMIFGAIMTRYRHLLHEDSFEIPHIYYKIGIERVWRRIPFLDSSIFVNHIFKSGVPMIEVDNMTLPEDGLFQLDGEIPKHPEGINPDMVDIFICVMDAFGIPRTLFSNSTPSMIEELVRKGLAR